MKLSLLFEAEENITNFEEYYQVKNIGQNWTEEERQGWLDQMNRAGQLHFKVPVSQAEQVVRKFNQKLRFSEGFVEEGHISAHYWVEGANLLGTDVSELFELRFGQRMGEPLNIEVFSYWIDNGGTIDPTALTDTPAEEDGLPVPTAETIKWLQQEYQLEPPKLPNFGDGWLNNLAYFCWAMPQLQNEVGMDQATAERTRKMRHDALLDEDEWGTYKLEITIPNTGKHTYYAEGRPSTLMATYGPDTIIVGKVNIGQ